MKDIIELNYSISTKKHPNSGIEILKTILTFLILVYHCINPNVSDNKILRILIQIVPFYFSTFFVIFFYFTYNIISSRNITKIKQRFLRIVIPYICWPIIFVFIHIISNDKKLKLINILRDLFIQLVIGRRIYFVFWFQFNLIIISLIMCIFIFALKKTYLNFFVIIFIISYILEYFGFIELFFEKYNEDLKRSVGRIIKMMIFSVTGLTLSSIKMLNYLKNYKMKSIFISFSSFLIIVYLKMYLSKYYFLEGIFLDLGAVCLLIGFALLPLEKITNMSIIFLLKQITSYTAGVYYIHLKIHLYFEDNIIIFKNGSLRGCALNYLICYSICFIGMKLFGKSKLKYLFI